MVSFGRFFGLYCLGMDNQGVPRDESHHSFRIRVGNDFLLVSVVSGIIFGAIAAH